MIVSCAVGELVEAEGELVEAEGELVEAEGELVEAEGELVEAVGVLHTLPHPVMLPDELNFASSALVPDVLALLVYPAMTYPPSAVCAIALL